MQQPPYSFNQTPGGYYYPWAAGQPMGTPAYPPQVVQYPDSSSHSEVPFVKVRKEEVSETKAPPPEENHGNHPHHHLDVKSVLHEVKVGMAGEENSWWDIFGLVNRLSLSRSKYRDAILAKYRFPIANFDHFFSITERETSFWTEFYGGFTTFFSMAYILALNPIIVGGAIGFQYKAGLFFSTCLASGVFTMLMGVLANLPVALAPGMGLNGYFANVCRVTESGVLVGILTWQQGLGSVFISGVLYLFMTITGLRFLLFKAVPLGLRHAISAGIGLFICIIGYKIGAILAINYYGGPIADFTKSIPFWEYDIGQIPLTQSAAGRITIVGLMWVSLFLTLDYRAGILMAIILTTFCGIVGNGLGPDTVTNLSIWHEHPIPFITDTSKLLAGHLSFETINTTHFWEVTWTFLFVEMFDSFGTLSTVVMKSGCMNKATQAESDRAINNAMLIDGWGLLFGSLVGSNSITPFIESLTGIAAGAKTGFASFITASLFLLSLLFVYPFVAIIPDSATVPALFMVGVYSISSIKEIDWDDFPIAFSSFMIIATMPFTYSIANGIAAGFIFYNWCVIVRFTKFRVLEAFNRIPRTPKDKTKSIWEEGWNPSNNKDFLPHWIMIVFGIFMILRYKFFF